MLLVNICRRHGKTPQRYNYISNLIHCKITTKPQFTNQINPHPHLPKYAIQLQNTNKKYYYIENPNWCCLFVLWIMNVLCWYWHQFDRNLYYLYDFSLLSLCAMRQLVNTNPIKNWITFRLNGRFGSISISRIVRVLSIICACVCVTQMRAPQKK